MILSQLYVGSTPHPGCQWQIKVSVVIPDPKNVIILVGDCYWVGVRSKDHVFGSWGSIIKGVWGEENTRNTRFNVP